MMKAKKDGLLRRLFAGLRREKTMKALTREAAMEERAAEAEADGDDMHKV